MPNRHDFSDPARSCMYHAPRRANSRHEFARERGSVRPGANAKALGSPTGMRQRVVDEDACIPVHARARATGHPALSLTCTYDAAVFPSRLLPDHPISRGGSSLPPPSPLSILPFFHYHAEPVGGGGKGGKEGICAVAFQSKGMAARYAGSLVKSRSRRDRRLSKTEDG